MICQNLHRYKQKKAFPKCQNRQFSYGKLAVLVRAAGLEPTVSWSQSVDIKNCNFLKEKLCWVVNIEVRIGIIQTYRFEILYANVVG